MRNDKLPARVIPLLYLGSAHVTLGLAGVLVGLWPRAVAGFFYHSWMVAIVHLVTLGWITFSILGAIYIVGPVALRMQMPSRCGDYVAFAFAIIGVIGMVSHFWIEEFGGMAWSAATVTGGVFYVAFRIVSSLRGAVIPAAVKLHLGFACLNITLAATAGILLGFDKAYHFLPGFVLSNVFAHAHLAAIGWATMMVVGVGYRLLPMTFPSKIPAGRAVFASAVLLEMGVLGLFVALLLQSAWALAFALVIVAGLASFVGHVIWMLRSRVTKPVAAPAVNFAVMHAAGAGVSLAMAIGLGISLLVMAQSPRSLRAAAAYGVFGLVGFLAQMVVAMETRLLPMFAWLWAYAGHDFQSVPPSPHVMRDRMLQGIVFAGWTVAVPALAAGFVLESVWLIATGGWALFVAVALGTVDNVFVLLHIRSQRHATHVSAKLRPLPR